jgi:hypothetical protein
VTLVDKKLDVGDSYAHAAPVARTVKTLVLLAALVAYGAGFVILYPLAASSVAKSVAEGADLAPIQFVGP